MFLTSYNCYLGFSMAFSPLPLVVLFFFLFWPCCAACRILVPRPGIEPMLPAVEAQILNHWTAREVPPLVVLYTIFGIHKFFMPLKLYFVCRDVASLLLLNLVLLQGFGELLYTGSTRLASSHP